MGLFSFLKKSSDPYNDSGTSLIYNLLFCDDLELYKANHRQPIAYPFDILFSETSSVADLQRIIEDQNADARVRILAYNKLLSRGHKLNRKELLAVIVEVGLDDGLDTLASFVDGTARYINQTGKVLIWETTTDVQGNHLTNELFQKSKEIIKQIGPWDKPRRPRPKKGSVRITFLVSDGLYFGEGPMNALFNDPIASPALTAATELMRYLTNKSLTSTNG